MLGWSRGDSEIRGPVGAALPKPAGRYVSMIVLALIAVGGLWGIVQDPRNAVAIVGWVGALILVCWVALVRPRITAYENGLQLTNMVRDVFIPWERIQRARAMNFFQVVTDEGTFSCTAVGRSARAQIRSDKRFEDRPNMATMMLGSSVSRVFGLGAQTDSRPSVSDYVEQLVMQEADEHTEARKRLGEPPRAIRRSWSVDGIGALVLAAAAIVAAVVL